MTKGQHVPALDGLRGFAAILVLVSHLSATGYSKSSPPFAGAFGVMLFFVLSGYLMAHLYLWKTAGRVQLIRYITARMARILPLYYLVLVSSFIISEFLGQSFIYYFDVVRLIRQCAFAGGAYVFWSIPPEVEFYFVFAGLWWIKSQKRLPNLSPALIMLTAVILLFRPIFPGTTVFSHLHIFLTGVGVALVKKSIDTMNFGGRPILAVQIISVSAIILLVMGIIPVQDSEWRSNSVIYGSLPISILFGAMLLAFTVETWFSKAVFANPISAKIGSYSFSIYLLHEPVMLGVHDLLDHLAVRKALQLPFGIASVALVAAISFRYFERPAQRLIRSLGDRVPLSGVTSA